MIDIPPVQTLPPAPPISNTFGIVVVNATRYALTLSYGLCNYASVAYAIHHLLLAISWGP